jgi:acyl transferase domain-containing protein
MRRAKKVFMFSGQGSQYFGMGRSLYEGEPVFRRAMDHMDAIVRDLSGYSVVKTLYYEGRKRSVVFDDIRLSHPALFSVQWALAQTLIDADLVPDLTLGTSLGSFVSAAVSGCLTAEDAMRSVVYQAAVIERCCAPGVLIAIFAHPSILDTEGLSDICAIISVNSSTHFVIAAQKSSAAIIENTLRRIGLAFQRLCAAYAFHSQWIDDARLPFEQYLRQLIARPAAIPFVSCVEPEILHELPHNYLWHVAREPIRFDEAITYLEGRDHYLYIDLGASGSATTALKYNLPSTSLSRAATILSPFGRDLENLGAVIESHSR